MTRTLLALALVFATACGASQKAKLHATALGVAHGILDTAGHTIEEACPLAVERAPDVDRAREIADACRRARDVQHLAVEVWMSWATATLARIESRKMDLELAFTAARRFLGLYEEMRQTLEGFDTISLPEPPPVLLRLVGAEE